MKSEELLPCPFCGQPGTYVHEENSLYPWQARCNNKDCYGCHDDYEQSKHAAKDKWNTRVVKCGICGKQAALVCTTCARKYVNKVDKEK